jgi:hypothetical protein
MTPGDIAFRLEGKIVRSLYRLSGTRSSSSPYISGDSFRALADHALDDASHIDPKTVADGDVLFVGTHELDRFRLEILPRIHTRFLLITHNSDVNIDEQRAAFADDERVVHWFAQNVAFRHTKITPIPIGLENRRLHCNGIVHDFDCLRQSYCEKKPRILYGFSVGTNIEERRPALAALSRSTCTDELEWTNSRAYRAKLNEYGFVASPPGNGIDCHRTWEALYLGVIPIVRQSPLFSSSVYPILPVNDWDDLVSYNESDLREKYLRISKNICTCKQLWMPYWVETIRLARHLAK